MLSTAKEIAKAGMSDFRVMSPHSKLTCFTRHHTTIFLRNLATPDFLPFVAFAAFARRAFTRFATSLALAAPESFRLGFSGAAAVGACGTASPLILAHL